jgi:AraC family transcriptional regulator
MFAPASYLEHYTKGTFAPHVAERHLVSESGVWMFDIVQPAGSFPDPPVPEFVLQRDMRGVHATVDFGAGRFSMRPDRRSMVIAPPMAASDIVVHDPHQIQTLAIPTSKIRSWSAGEARDAGIADLGRLHSTGFKNFLIEQLLDRLWAEAAEGEETILLQTEAVLLTLWSELLRQARKPLGPIARGGLAPWQARRCIEYLNDHAGDNVGLEQLAALVGLSPFHFARAFKQTTGVPPHRYQLKVRIEKAKALLEATDTPVTQIAFEVGYESSQALARLFRREVGVSPSDYRRLRGARRW